MSLLVSAKGITMILVIAILFCSCATLKASEYPSYYVSEYSQPQNEEEYQEDSYGDNYGQDYDQSGLRKFQKSQENYGAGQYNDDQEQALRDIAQQQAHKSGAQASLHSSGGQKGHVSNAHNRGSYQKEKKYGYEKAYGYEKESKSHDSAANSKSYTNGYNHNENKAHHNEQASALRDLASKNQKHKSGSQSQGSNGILLDLNQKLNRGREYGSKYGNQNNAQQNFQFIQQPVRVFKQYRRPIYLRSYLPQGQTGFNRHHFTGISGLGGLRGYGMGYGFNPFRYGYLDDFLFSDLGIKKPLINSYGHYNSYYSNSEN